MQLCGRTLVRILVVGLLGCAPRSMVEPLDPGEGARPPLPTPPPGVLVPPPVYPPPVAVPPAEGEGANPPVSTPGAPPAQPPPGTGAATIHPDTSFFVTSRGSQRGGGDFRARTADPDGLAGADQLCRELATAALPGLAIRSWRAYLSTEAEDARDRIGVGPWRNARGTIVAENVQQLHEEGRLRNSIVAGDAVNVLDEKGNPIDPARHDVLTGTAADGTVDPQGRTCNNWRSQSAQAQALVGHADRRSATGDTASATGRSWNASHAVDCGPLPAAGANRLAGTVSENGGQGSIYCFAAD
jgi:hypothetical protein